MALTDLQYNQLVAALGDYGTADTIRDILDVQAAISGAEAAFLDGAVAGTPAAGKAVVAGTALAIWTIGDTTIDTSKTLAVTTADKLTVGGLIVPQAEI